VHQRRTATSGYSTSSGSAASGELRASLSRLSAASVALSGTMVYSSIVMAILLCRRIRIATRGCTSKAASSEPQVRRVSCTRMRRTPALAQRRSKRRLTARGSIARPERVVNTRPSEGQVPPLCSFRARGAPP